MTLDPIAILRHGIRSVLRNAGATLRISWPWLIIIAIAYVLFAFVMTTSGFGTTPLDSEKGAAPVLLAGLILFIVSGVVHMKLGMQVIIEDYVPAEGTRIAALIANIFFCAAVGLVGVLAVLKLAFGG